MKTDSAVMIVVLSILLASCCLADGALMQWQFDKTSGQQGWFSVGGQIGVDKDNGWLTSTGSDCKVVSPLFDMKASPWQLVEVEMRTDKTGITRLFYSNTTDEPYGGFREELQTQFTAIGDGKFHKYMVLPCWQGQGKIIHIRLDPPGARNAIAAVRIRELEPSAAGSGTDWKFMDTAAGWQLFGTDAKPTLSGAGWGIGGDSSALALSPALDVQADDAPYLTFRVASKSPHSVLFRWVCADRGGVQSVPVQVVGGGKFHSYVIDLTTVPEWSGRIVAVGVTPSDTEDAAAVTVESVTLAKQAVGPAEIRVRNVGLVNPVTRVGDKARVFVEVENIGGAEAKSVNAVVSLSMGAAPKLLPAKSVVELASGKTARLEWETKFDQAGTVYVSSSGGAQGIESTQKQVALRIYPKLDKAIKSLKYVPEPQVANTGDYHVGCYYFPGWREYGAWSAINDFPERRPVLGYANDGNPEVVDWQINWAVSHGIEYFIYDWYWNKGGRGLEEGLNDGFLKSRHQDKMKFCLLWANHNGPGSHSEADMIAVTKYWIDNYFNRPNYMKINGKNVMVIFNPGGFTSDMGDDAARTAIAKMKKMCEDSGVGGLYMVACVWPNAGFVKELESIGFDAFSGYNYPNAGDRGQTVAPYAWLVDAFPGVWREIASAATVPYIPLCEAGWDARPWHGPATRVRSGKSADLWQKMLANGKAYVDDPKNKLPEGQKLVFCEAWNEFGEGDYIEPNAGDGFSYLEAIRKVFAPSSKPPVIVAPQDLGMGPYDVPSPSLKTAWDFAKPSDQVWIAGNMSSADYNLGLFRAQASGTDPILQIQGVQIDADKLKTLEIKMKVDRAGIGQVFFTRKREIASEDKSVKFHVNGDGEFHTYNVDMASNTRWNRTITGLRLDPIDAKDAKMEIAYIRMK